VKLLRAYWVQHPADLVLSVIPHFNREIADSLRTVGTKTPGTKTPFVTLITDLADYPPHFWIERESEYIIAGTDRARQQALTMGHAADHLFQTSGMILKPRFYEKSQRRSRCRKKETRLGSRLSNWHRLVRRPWLAGDGRHREKTQRSRQRRAVSPDLWAQPEARGSAQEPAGPRKPIAVVGFAQNVEYYMALADFFIGKPGPGSISEALQFHLPVIVECNSKTLPQERYNAEWVTENGYGIVVPSFRRIVPAVQHLS
jgi:hypothetical protein